MKYSLSLALSLFALATYASPVPVLSAEISLSQAAAQLGYGYAYLGPEDAVELTRPGLVVLVRPGEKLIDVNDRTEAVEESPRFVKDDLFVSDSFVRRLRQLAGKYPASAVSQGEVPVTTGEDSLALMPRKSVHSGAIALDVHQVPGTQSLSVSGTAPATAPITITLKETFSSDIPDVVLNRTEFSADADGHFEGTVSVAPGYFRGGLITVVASSLPNITTASSQIVLKSPNDGVHVPAEDIPRSIR